MTLVQALLVCACHKHNLMACLTPPRIYDIYYFAIFYLLASLLSPTIITPPVFFYAAAATTTTATATTTLQHQAPPTKAILSKLGFFNTPFSTLPPFNEFLCQFRRKCLFLFAEAGLCIYFLLTLSFRIVCFHFHFFLIYLCVKF